MSDLNSIIDFLEGSEIQNPPTDSYVEPVEDGKKKKSKKKTSKTAEEEKNDVRVFDIREFGQELYQKSEKRNRERALRPYQNITGYDIAHNCIMHVLFKLRNTPIQNYADSWLPIFMRTEVGTAVHNFLQLNTKQFTEVEVNLKVPSIGFYGKIDYMIGNNLLGEIKTCTYEDYARVIRKQKPRDKDFLQAITYHYMLHKHLDEAKNSKITTSYGGERPKLDEYNVKTLQFIYVSHDLISSQAESYAEMLEKIKDLKRTLNSKNNQFFFITSIVVNLDDEVIKNSYEFISNKLDDIHHYMKTSTNPTAESRYVDPKGCFFCPYRSVCDLTTFH